MWEPLTQLGIDPSMVLAGLFGGACKGLIMKEPSPSSTGISAFVGACASNYAGLPIADHFAWPRLISGFGSGVCGMLIIQAMQTYGSKLIPQQFRGP